MKILKLFGAISIFTCLAAYTLCFSETDKFATEKKQQITNLYGKLPLTFVENRGQFDKQVRFCARSPKTTVYFCTNEVVFHFVEKPKGIKSPHALETSETNSAQAEEKYKELVLRVSFSDTNPNVLIEGLDKLPVKVNVFRGSDQSKWLKDIPTYKKIIYHNLWEGIDLVYYGMPEYGMKYDLIVHPGADPTKAKLKYAGHDKLSVNSEGELIVNTAFVQIVEKKPYVYQQIKGNNEEVKGTFSVSNDIVTLNLEDYDTNYPLIIDPGLAYSTFLGGTSYDSGYFISTDSSGCAYVTGVTYLTGFPTTVGAYDTSSNGEWDIFITKLNASGTGLVYSTFLGGASDDYGHGVDVDSSGSVYVTGYTESSDFPATTGAYDTLYNGTGDVFVTKLNASGTGLVYSTFLGGASDDYGHGVDVDSSGSAYVTGYTESSDFPATIHAFDTSYNGFMDVFVTKLNSTGTGLVYSTFLGGTSYEYGYGISIDSSGCAYITGGTGSSDFPATAGAYDTSCNGNQDVFVTKLNSTGTGLVYSTFLGGISDDVGFSVSVDSSGCAYVTGLTESSDFPATAGAYDTSCNSIFSFLDAFVTKLNATGTGLVYSTFLGGIDNDYSHGISIDSSGCAYITGETESSDFPATTDAYDTLYNGMVDVFMTKLNASGTALVYSTFLGGISDDVGLSVSVDSSGRAYITGETESSDFPATTDAYDTSQNGNHDVFMTKILMKPYIYSITYDGSTVTIFWNPLRGMSYIVEWSEDMSSWTQVPVGQVGEWTDTNVGRYAKKFYRVRED